MNYKVGAIKFAKRFGGVARNTLIGAAAGTVTGGIVSTSNDAPAGMRTGSQVGAAIGIGASLPFRNMGRALKTASTVFARGLKADPASKVGAALRRADKSVRQGKVVFRRIRGRLIPIRTK
jgi:hypothetical protein